MRRIPTCLPDNKIHDFILCETDLELDIMLNMFYFIVMSFDGCFFVCENIGYGIDLDKNDRIILDEIDAI